MGTTAGSGWEQPHYCQASGRSRTQHVSPPAGPVTAERTVALPAAGRGAGLSAQESLRLLVETHGRSMLRLARSIVAGDQDLAEDIVQESLIKVWRGLDTYRADAPIEHWIMRITHNTAVSALRARREDPWDPAELPAQVVVSAERTALGREDLRALNGVVRELDELSRAILALRELEGMSYEEIAATLDVSVAVVKIRLFRARTHLREELGLGR